MLEILSLSLAYADKIVLKDVSLSIHPGEILALVGPNGAGKSTLIRGVSGVHPPRSGSVIVDGRDLTLMSEMQRARYLAVVPQARLLPAAYTVYEAVLLGRTPYLNWLGRAGAHDHAMVRLALERTSLLELADQRIGELSGGEQQRVLLARALAQDTPILLLDEPTTHLDLQHQSNFLNLVRRMALEKQLMVLMVLHDLNLAGLYADSVALLANGSVVAIGAPGEVITAKNLTSVYHVPVNVIPHPDYGTPLVLPDGRLDPIVSTDANSRRREPSHSPIR